MRINQMLLVFDAADITAESRFWAAVLDGQVQVRPDWHKIVVNGQTRLAVQLVPEHQPPEWPNGLPQQAHLDLWIEDLSTAHEDVTRLGARLLQPVQDGANFQVYADPAGHPFCLCWEPG